MQFQLIGVKLCDDFLHGESSVQDLDFASLDHHRALRTGFPEVVYGEGKTIPQLIAITQNLASQSDQILVTRVTQDIFKEVQQVIPDLSFNEAARSMYIDRNPG